VAGVAVAVALVSGTWWLLAKDSTKDHLCTLGVWHTVDLGFTLTASAAGTRPSPSIKLSGAAGSAQQPGKAA